jgi:hypothetical protein
VLNKILVLVPTRNRPALAERAVGSVLECPAPSVQVMVSDNSTASTCVEELASFVAQRNDPRLSLIRPPSPLPMATHWDWALREGLRDESISHVVVLTDRMMFKIDGLESLLAIVARNCDKIISYDHDRIVDHCTPITVDLSPWSDDVLLVQSKRLLGLSAISSFPPALPRLLNSVVPRSILEGNVKIFGSIVGSIAPDYSFCYRSLSIVKEIAYWDRAPIFHYALGESNGESVSRGMSTAASTDFMSGIHGTIFAAAPCPGIRTIRNAIMHEYCVVQNGPTGVRLPPVDLEKYVSVLWSEIKVMENRAVARDMQQALAQWCTESDRSFTVGMRCPTKNGLLRRTARRLRIGPSMLRARQKLSAISVWARGRETRRVFATLDTALQYASTMNGERTSSKRLSDYQ